MSDPLLVRLPNWVGDVCMALPALRALDDAGFALTLAGRGWVADLLAGHGWPLVRLPAGLREAARALRAPGVRHGLLLTNSLSSALAFRLAGVSALGLRNEGRGLLLGRVLPRVRGLHEVEAFWRLAAATCAWRRAGADWPGAPPASLGLVLTPAHRTTAREALRAAGLHEGVRVVVLAPLAAGTTGGASKAWPGFGELDRALAARGLVTVCCPGPGEEAAARAALPASRQLAGLGLGTYAAACAEAALTVANDSGPMHLAAAAGAPVLGVFGPGDPARTRPWSPAARWLGGGGTWPDVAAVLKEVDRMLDRPAGAP
jgi:heptosyltransferase-2